jgi:hypothetical protein
MIFLDLDKLFKILKANLSLTEISSVNSCNINSFNFITSLRNFFHFHFSVGSNEQKFCIRKSFLISSAIAMAGKMCPPVPPPDNNTFNFDFCYLLMVYSFLFKSFYIRLSNIVYFCYALFFAHSFFIINLNSGAYI